MEPFGSAAFHASGGGKMAARHKLHVFELEDLEVQSPDSLGGNT